MVSFLDLEKKISSYIHYEKDLNLIKEAYELANEKHKGQLRKSGEPYIIHPLSVAMILADLNVGPNTLIAAILHDVVEDTDCGLEMIAEKFGNDVASIVDGVTKVTQMKFSSLEKQQAENHQKMIIAMAKDIRVIVVKLADRLHNLRTLEFQSPEKQVRIALETLEIYAPLAHKLGMFKIKAELEDTALKYTDPALYKTISELIDKRLTSNDNYIDHMIDKIKEYMSESNICDYQIKGRIKNQYSIYKKMMKQAKAFEDIYDILAIRIIVDRVETCYHVLGIIHAHFTPIPKRFKDYIAVPKPNMYQSLHTTVIGVDGDTFEIQIRTHEMDHVAEYGIAAHWAYKENVEYSKEKEQYEIAQKLKWYAELLQITNEEKSGEAEELVNTIKGDILDANIYVYTPKGEVVALPKGATPLDFAYKIHTDIGNKTVGAIVNNKIVPLSYELQTGDIITMRINKNSFGPSEDWLKIVKTNHAKHKIKGFLNKQNRDVLLASGEADIERELTAQKVHGSIDDEFVKQHFGKNNIYTAEDLYVEVGKGAISAKTVVTKLAGGEGFDRDASLQKQLERNHRILTTNSETGVVVEGLSNPQIKLANCCYPIPGDKIIGYVSKGNGIVVHCKDCANVNALEEERLLDLEWATNIDRKYPVSIKISASQTNGIITDIINTVNSYNLGIAQINTTTNQNFETIIKLKILVKNKLQLDNLIVNLQRVPHVHGIERE
jgi:GTP pyrophosphokinase